MNGNLKKIILILVASSMLIIAGCGGLGSSRNKCALGDACQYYQGTEGVRMRVDRPPTTLYYSKSALGDPEGNQVEFNVEVTNQGPSWASGAVFISGFDPNLFRLYKFNNNQWEPILISSNQMTCYLDILGWSSSTLGFLGGCSDIGQGGVFSGGNWWIDNLNIGNVFQLFGVTLPDYLQGVTINIDRQSGGNFNIGVGIDGTLFDFFLHGQYLMVLMQGFDLGKLGGSTYYLRGDNADYPGGDMDYEQFKVQMIREWPAGQDYIRVPYQIKQCYAYTTFVSPMICVDPNPYSDEKKVCRSESYSWGGSQGAPVAVTRMEQVNTGKEVIMEFTIRNVGRGQVWDFGKIELCSPYNTQKVTGQMYDVVYVGDAYIGGVKIDCSANQKIRLDPNTKEARFMCKYPLDLAYNVGSAYTTSLKMELWYGYEEIYSNTLMVRRIG